jgi:hypothetical protein
MISSVLLLPIAANIAIIKYARVALSRPDEMRIENHLANLVAAGGKVAVREVDTREEDWIQGPIRGFFNKMTVLLISIDGCEEFRLNDGLPAHRIIVVCSECEPAFYAMTQGASPAPRMVKILNRIAWRSEHLMTIRETAVVRLAGMNLGRDWNTFVRKRVKHQIRKMRTAPVSARNR